MKDVKNYYADTSFIIDLIEGVEEAKNKLEKIDDLVTGTPVIYELNKFPGYSANLSRKVIELNIEDVEKSAEIWRDLDSQGNQIGEIDHIIAGQAMNRDTTLITRDRDFEEIEELEVEYFL